MKIEIKHEKSENNTAIHYTRTRWIDVYKTNGLTQRIH